jgi:ubiquinone biosynthesis protein UbiJ
MPLETLFHAGQAWHNETLSTLKQNMLEFLQEETRDLPASAEVDILYKQITDLVRDTQTLNDKIDGLLTQSTKNN